MTELKELREATVFESIFTETSDLITKLDLNPLAVPRRRRPPARFTGPAAAHHAESAVEHFRMAYFQLVDGMMNNLSDRFGEGSKADLQDYQKLEEIITTGIVDQDILHKYPEFNTNLTAFKTQLDMFLHTSKATTIEGATRAYQNMSADVRALFPDVKSLLKLMLVCPVTSCECERSFSALRRLKTWLRSTMTQTRLNSCAVCNIHKLVLDDIDVVPLAAQFASRSETRKICLVTSLEVVYHFEDILVMILGFLPSNSKSNQAFPGNYGGLIGPDYDYMAERRLFLQYIGLRIVYAQLVNGYRLHACTA
ncbi:uncharacterized protein [Amphiura filiformis]|uniref:uncharacterized protein n=1 Tax=Amphiura filiformis TaxID=82378 RepID=UPI003B2185EE